MFFDMCIISMYTEFDFLSHYIQKVGGANHAHSTNLVKISSGKKLLCLLFLFSTLFLAVAAPLKSYIMQWIIDAPDKQAAILCLFQGIAIILLSHMLEYASRMSFTKMACKSCEQILRQMDET